MNKYEKLVSELEKQMELGIIPSDFLRSIIDKVEAETTDGENEKNQTEMMIEAFTSDLTK